MAVAESAKGFGVVVNFYRSHLRQVVAIHYAMFQKLLLDEDGTPGVALAELFQDVGKTYIQISEQMNCSVPSLKD